MSWLKTLVWILLTGGLKSRLLSIPEHQPFRVVKAGGRLLVEPIPTQMDPEQPVHFDVGQRVIVAPHAGFHRGARGAVEFHAPDGRVWVMRDGASSCVFYYPHELIKDPSYEVTP